MTSREVRIGSLTFRRTEELFDDFEWTEANRQTHFEKHGIDFPIVRGIDWTDILKAPDRRDKTAKRDRRNVALARHKSSGLIAVVVYSKTRRIGRIISVRRANALERAAFNEG